MEKVCKEIIQLVNNVTPEQLVYTKLKRRMQLEEVCRRLEYIDSAYKNYVQNVKDLGMDTDKIEHFSCHPSTVAPASFIFEEGDK